MRMNWNKSTCDRATLVDISAVIKNNKKNMLSHLFKYMIDLYQTRKPQKDLAMKLLILCRSSKTAFKHFNRRWRFFQIQQAPSGYWERYGECFSHFSAATWKNIKS